MRAKNGVSVLLSVLAILFVTQASLVAAGGEYMERWDYDTGEYSSCEAAVAGWWYQEEQLIKNARHRWEWEALLEYWEYTTVRFYPGDGKSGPWAWTEVAVYCTNGLDSYAYVSIPLTK